MPITHKEITAVLLAAYGSLDRVLEMDLNDGVCHNCGHIQSGIEPDARCCSCEACKEDTVFGVEETIITMP